LGGNFSRPRSSCEEIIQLSSSTSHLDASRHEPLLFQISPRIGLFGRWNGNKSKLNTFVSSHIAHCSLPSVRFRLESRREAEWGSGRGEGRTFQTRRGTEKQQGKGSRNKERGSESSEEERPKEGEREVTDEGRGTFFPFGFVSLISSFSSLDIALIPSPLTQHVLHHRRIQDPFSSFVHLPAPNPKLSLKILSATSARLQLARTNDFHPLPSPFFQPFDLPNVGTADRTDNVSFDMPVRLRRPFQTFLQKLSLAD